MLNRQGFKISPRFITQTEDIGDTTSKKLLIPLEMFRRRWQNSCGHSVLNRPFLLRITFSRRHGSVVNMRSMYAGVPRSNLTVAGFLFLGTEFNLALGIDIWLPSVNSASERSFQTRAHNILTSRWIHRQHQIATKTTRARNIVK